MQPITSSQLGFKYSLSIISCLGVSRWDKVQCKGLAVVSPAWSCWGIRGPPGCIRPGQARPSWAPVTPPWRPRQPRLGNCRTQPRDKCPSQCWPGPDVKATLEWRWSLWSVQEGACLGPSPSKLWVPTNATRPVDKEKKTTGTCSPRNTCRPSSRNTSELGSWESAVGETLGLVSSSDLTATAGPRTLPCTGGQPGCSWSQGQAEWSWWAGSLREDFISEGSWNWKAWEALFTCPRRIFLGLLAVCCREGEANYLALGPHLSDQEEGCWVCSQNPINVGSREGGMSLFYLHLFCIKVLPLAPVSGVPLMNCVFALPN